MRGKHLQHLLAVGAQHPAPGVRRPLEAEHLRRSGEIGWRSGADRAEVRRSTLRRLFSMRGSGGDASRPGRQTAGGLHLA